MMSTATIRLPRDLRDEAERRYAAILESGKTVPWSEMRRYLERRLSSNKVPRPKPKTFARYYARTQD